MTFLFPPSLERSRSLWRITDMSNPVVIHLVRVTGVGVGGDKRCAQVMALKSLFCLRLKVVSLPPNPLLDEIRMIVPIAGAGGTKVVGQAAEGGKGGRGLELSGGRSERAPPPPLSLPPRGAAEA